jgi:hypothetical protein
MPKVSRTGTGVIEVIDAAIVTSVERRWAQAIASWSRADLATRCMRATARIPHHATRLIN